MKARIAVVAVIVIAVIVAMRFLPVGEWLRGFQSWVSSLGAVGALVYAAAYVVAALLFVPGSVLTLGAGVTFGLVGGTIIVSVASTTAAALAFLIARHLARARVEELARKNETFGAIEEAIRRRGWKVVLLLRLSPVVPFSLSNYLYGLTPVAFVPYVLASWVGMLPATVLYVYLGVVGAAAARGGRPPAEWALLGAGLAATVVVAVWVGRAARRELKVSKRNSEGEKNSGPRGS